MWGMWRVSLAVLLALAINGAMADNFYKWVDGNGVTHYSEAPPEQGQANTVNVELKPAGAPPPAPPVYRSSSPAVDKKVVIYSAAWCGVCKQAKRYFREHDVPFTDYDVETSAKGKADYSRLNGHGVPIILVGSARMDGFSAGGFEQLWRAK